MYPEKEVLLSGKVQLLNYSNPPPPLPPQKKISFRDIAEIFKIGKISAPTIKKSVDKLRKEYASLQGNRKQNCQRNFHKFNEAVYFWYTKCCAANLYLAGALIQEEACQMKKRIVEAVPELDRFHASNEWFESFKKS